MPEIEDMLPSEENMQDESRKPSKAVEEFVEAAEQPEADEDVIPTRKVEKESFAPEAEDAPQVLQNDKPPKGFVPYQALDEERRKRKELETQLKNIQITSVSSEIPAESLSDEGRLLQNKIEEQNKKIAMMIEEQNKERLFNKYPVLLDKEDEFNDFKLQYPGVPTDKVAKLFLSERNLLENKPPRKGLERPTSGPKSQREEVLTTQDVDRYMKGDEKKLQKMIMSGQLDKIA
jgi:hypothetical protein